MIQLDCAAKPCSYIFLYKNSERQAGTSNFFYTSLVILDGKEEKKEFATLVQGGRWKTDTTKLFVCAYHNGKETFSSILDTAETEFLFHKLADSINPGDILEIVCRQNRKIVDRVSANVGSITSASS